MRFQLSTRSLNLFRNPWIWDEVIFSCFDLFICIGDRMECLKDGNLRIIITLPQRAIIRAMFIVS